MSFVHSWTSLNKFETCPRQFEWSYVQKNKEDPAKFAEYRKWGVIVHEAVELRIKKGSDEPMPEGTERFQVAIDAAKMAKQQGLSVYTEEKIAMSRDGKAVNFWSKDAFVRAQVDLAILARTRAEMIDLKTGKWKSDRDQMRMNAWIAFHQWPGLTLIQTRYLWLQGGDQNAETHARAATSDAKSTLATLAGDFIPRIERVERALAGGVFDPKPSGLCRAHCPVFSCEHNGRSE